MVIKLPPYEVGWIYKALYYVYQCPHVIMSIHPQRGHRLRGDTVKELAIQGIKYK